MHSSRMRTARTLPYGGLPPTKTPLRQRPPWTRPPPLDRPTPWTETHTLHRDLPWAETPWTETLPESHQTETPLNRDPPWTDTHTPDGDSPLAETLPDRDPPDRDPLDRDPPWAETHLDRDPPGQIPRPPCRQTDTCENITFANFVCGW